MELLLQVGGKAVPEQGLDQSSADKAAKDLQQIALQACSRSVRPLLLSYTGHQIPSVWLPCSAI